MDVLDALSIGLGGGGHRFLLRLLATIAVELYIFSWVQTSFIPDRALANTVLFRQWCSCSPVSRYRGEGWIPNGGLNMWNPNTTLAAVPCQNEGAQPAGGAPSTIQQFT